MTHPIELELKYRADGPAPMAALAAAERLGDARLGPVSVSDELDRYLDTADLRLAAARWACRLRTRHGRTVVSLKGPAEQAGGALHRRPEVEGPAEPGRDPRAWPPSPARDLLARLSGEGELLERFVLAQRRSERGVTVRGRLVGLLSIDESTVLHRGRERGRLLTVELELRDDAAAVELAAALDGIAGLRPEPHTKLEHALAMILGPAAGRPSPPAAGAG